mgnify:CR=1 FL=1
MPPQTPTGIPFPLLRNSAGKPDVMFTLVILFGLAAGLTFAFGGSTYVGHGLTLQVPRLDSASVGALFTVFSGYVARRHGIGAKGTAAPPAPAPPA